MSRYRQSGEPPQPSPQQPPTSQADSYSQVPKTHRVMTLADHISVSNADESEKEMQNIPDMHKPIIRNQPGFVVPPCPAAYHNPGLRPESGTSPGLLLSFSHIPERGAIGVLFRSSQGVHPLQSGESGPGLTPPETLQQSFPRECP